MTTNQKRLIEVAFPLKQVSLDSVHEKNVRHGHISTLHIWPARRPLAACRAALIATLLPDPGDTEQRRLILERLAGKVTEKVERKRVNGRIVEKVKEETTGGILHWGRENGPDLAWFRHEIRQAYGGRAPKVLDPFAGGGAIPLEAMRLGCQTTAMDINPVAWFILKCTLEYPQKLAGQTRPLPEFALADREFMEAFLKAQGFKGAGLRTALARLGHEPGQGQGRQMDALPPEDPATQADLAWHVRAWGRRTLAQARRELAASYPTYAEFQPLTSPKDGGDGAAAEQRPPQLLDTDANGLAQLAPLNAEFDDAYLQNPHNPRWVAKPTVAYLWARTVACKQCRATLPLLKTRWLCKKDNKRVLLTMTPTADGSGVAFGVLPNAPQNGGNGAQRRQHDQRLGAGTMSRAGATCPCCRAIMTMHDIRSEGQGGRLGAVMTAVVVDGLKGKEYRRPTEPEIAAAAVSEEQLQALYADIPFGLPEEPILEDAKGNTWCMTYGLNSWRKLFTNRQIIALASFLKALESIKLMAQPVDNQDIWAESIVAYLASTLDRLANQSSAICHWHNIRENVEGTFARFALPIVWDFVETNPLGTTTGGYLNALEWVSRVVSHTCSAASDSPDSTALCQSVLEPTSEKFDIIVTDPPYYDAIGYAVLMDYFYVWLRRSIYGMSSEIDSSFRNPLVPKWDHSTRDGELIDDASRFGGDKVLSKQSYEDGMARAFQACHGALRSDGRLVVAFANKQPDAWETLVAALIRAGFVVDSSWPIQTEMTTRTRAMASSALASSVWLVCKKRPPGGPGWDNTVLAEMRKNVTQKLRDFWDAGIRGPDFVWAATGPALEAFSKHPAVLKANASEQALSVSEFLREVRRMVVDFVVGRVLTRDGAEAVTGLDDVTTYYLLHRNDFGLAEAPVGGCILYALSCNLSDSALAHQYDLLAQSQNNAPAADSPDAEAGDEEGEDGGENGAGGNGAQVKLKGWERRQGRGLGLDAGGRPAPLIDQVHRLMHLWRAGDQVRVNEYLDGRGLPGNALFHQLLQALIELAPAGSEERAILEALSNHAAAHGDVRRPRQRQLPLGGVK